MTDHQAKLFSLPRLKKMDSFGGDCEAACLFGGDCEAACLFIEQFAELRGRLFGALGLPQEYFILDDEARHRPRLVYGTTVRPPSSFFSLLP